MDTCAPRTIHSPHIHISFTPHVVSPTNVILRLPAAPIFKLSYSNNSCTLMQNGVELCLQLETKMLCTSILLLCYELSWLCYFPSIFTPTYTGDNQKIKIKTHTNKYCTVSSVCRKNKKKNLFFFLWRTFYEKF